MKINEKLTEDIRKQINDIKTYNGIEQENGYCELPNGFIIQWGNIPISSFSKQGNSQYYSASINFPKLFTQFCIVQESPLWNATGDLSPHFVMSKSLTGAKFLLGANVNNSSVMWIAVGK